MSYTINHMTRRDFHTLSTAAGIAALSATSRAADAKPRIKIAQIGTTHAHATGQLAALRECADFEVIGVWEPDEKKRASALKEAAFNGLRWMSKDELFNTPGLQAVTVETEVGDLLAHAQLVADAGLHLHLDKPAGDSLPKFRKVMETLTSKKRLLKMGYMFRFNPAIEFAFHAVREGWLGDVFSVDAVMSKVLGEAERKPMLRYTGGSMFELGCHIIESAVRLMGRPQKVTPYARQMGGDGFSDNMLAVLEYPKAMVTMRSAFVEVEGGTRRQFVVCGTHGTCDIRPLEPGKTLRLALDQPHAPYVKGYQDVALPKLPRYAADWTAFAKAIRGEEAWPFSPEHDIATQETVLLAAGLPTE